MPRKRALKPEVADGIREVRLGAHRAAGDDVTKARNNRNRRIRNRSYGGVGGRGPRGPLLPDPMVLAAQDTKAPVSDGYWVMAIDQKGNRWP